MKKATYTMTEKVFLYPGETANWHFVPITKKVGQEIKEKYGKAARGFGSLKVEVTVGKTTWLTSVFPDSYSGSYLLPLKSQVRKKEDIEAGEKIKFTIRLV
ncbi:MAG: DUF1905 domain-containing protein [Candidatus Paceibacterota bacterium]